MTKSVLLAFQQGFVDVVLTSRGGAPKRIGAGCDWRRGAGIDTSDRKMIIVNFNKAAGFDCMVNVGDSAEERGYFLIDPAPDAVKSLSTCSCWSPDRRGKRQSWARPKATVLDLGPEDSDSSCADQDRFEGLRAVQSDREVSVTVAPRQ